MDTTIEPMTPADAAEVLALWRGIEGLGLHDNETAEWIEDFLRQQGEFSFVARAGGEIVGALMVSNDGRRGYLHHLAVAESSRGAGLGRKLVDASLAALAAAGIVKCHVMVFADNDPAADFWRAVGFAERTDLKLFSRSTNR